MQLELPRLVAGELESPCARVSECSDLDRLLVEGGACVSEHSAVDRHEREVAVDRLLVAEPAEQL